MIEFRDGKDKIKAEYTEFHCPFCGDRTVVYFEAHHGCYSCGNTFGIDVDFKMDPEALDSLRSAIK